MPSRAHEIHRPAELSAFSRVSVYRSRRRHGPLLLRGNLPHARRLHWERELNELFFACGCDTGAKALRWAVLPVSGLALLACALGWVGAPAALGFTLGGYVVVGVTGKLHGLRQAQRRLTQLVEEIQAAWPTGAEQRHEAAAKLVLADA